MAELTEGLIKRSEIGPIPTDWDVLPVSRFGKILTGTTPSTKESKFYGGAYPFISPGDISEHTYVKEAAKTITKKGLSVCRPLPKNTILVVCIGATIGKTALTWSDESATNQQINAVITQGNFDPLFVYYALKFRAGYLPALAGRSAVPIVNKSVFSEFLLPAPPLQEQRHRPCPPHRAAGEGGDGEGHRRHPATQGQPDAAPVHFRAGEGRGGCASRVGGD